MEFNNKYLKSLFMNDVFNDNMQILGVAEGFAGTHTLAKTT
jgi:hypothetical protein